MSPGTLAPTGDADADHLLNTNPLALLFGMLLDQQIAIERAFAGPHRLCERLGFELDPETICAMDPDEFTAAVTVNPALHRFPAAMADRMLQLSRAIVDEYQGDAESIWHTARTGAELFDRLQALPGFGDEKAKILMAVLAKRFDVAPDGWADAAAPFSDDQPRTVADVDGPAAMARVRDWKQAQKAQGKEKDE